LEPRYGRLIKSQAEIQFWFHVPSLQSGGRIVTAIVNSYINGLEISPPTTCLPIK
jgi:hypothetical protein